MPTEVLRWDLAAEKAAFVGTGKQLPRPRRSFAGAVLGKEYYLVGGLGADMKLVSPVDVFDFETGKWSGIPGTQAPPLCATWRRSTASSTWPEAMSQRRRGISSRPNRSRFTTRPASAWSTVVDSLPVPPGDVKIRPVQGRLLLFAMDREKPRSCHLALVAP